MRNILGIIAGAIGLLIAIYNIKSYYNEIKKIQETDKSIKDMDLQLEMLLKSCTLYDYKKDTAVSDK